MFESSDFGASGASGLGLDFGSPQISSLEAALIRLAGASDGVTEAVTHHDRGALEAANERADVLMAEIGQLATALSPPERALLPQTGVPALCERLAAGARRNALLIENAWAVDAALMRLLLGLGKAGSDRNVGGYGSDPGPAYLDRQA